MLHGKTILLGVSGSIAAYKAAALASALVKQNAAVHVLMTRNATEFITPMTFESLTHNRCVVDTFDRSFEFKIGHISLAKRADLCVIAPASANVLAKLAHGLADDMLTTTALACRCPKIAAPAMNTGMYENPVTQDNLRILKEYGWQIAEPAAGRLACGDVGAGKMLEPDVLVELIMQAITQPKDMQGLHVLVTAGATREPIDPVRFITNHSSGKMGYAIAQAAARRGALVTLVSGATALLPPVGVELVQIGTAREMFEAVTAAAPAQDIIIKAAAVADYRPTETAPEKLKKGDGDMTLSLTRTDDILQYLGEHRAARQFLCGFAMETRDLLENARAKLARKHVDMIAANSLREEGAGFAVDTNRLTLITADNELALPLVSKAAAAQLLLNEILRLRQHDKR